MIESNGPDRSTKFELSPRDAFVLVLALVTGLAAGFLLWTVDVLVAQAVLGGVGITAFALKFFDSFIK